jgi:hypothetical protein
MITAERDAMQNPVADLRNGLQGVGDLRNEGLPASG